MPAATKLARRKKQIMTKRIFALLLCAATLLTTLVGCDKKDDEYKGQYITTYLTDNVYDLDPAHAYNNEALANVVGLMFDTLFKLDEKGKVKKSLVKEYKIHEDDNAEEYYMEIYLKNTCWSDGTPISANDVVFAWKRLLEVDANYEAACLLFDIKNARAAKEGDMSIDDVAIYPEEPQMLKVTFEGPIDYDHFIRNLTSLALAPLRENVVTKSDDWAKKPGTMVCSGPFKLSRVNLKLEPSVKYYDETHKEFDEVLGEYVYGKDCSQQIITDFMLERNNYYYRDAEEDSLFKSVKPYKICVDCSMTDEQLLAAYEAGMILYIGDIPMSLRKDTAIAKDAEKESYSLSTNSIYLNQKAMIDDGSEEGFALFADAKVRQALSMVIDRQALADAIVYAEAATGLIPTGVYETDSIKKKFRAACDASYTALAVDEDAAKTLLSEAKITPSKYSFSITCAAYDEVHCFVAETVAEAWNKLGFNVTVNKRGTIVNNDYYKHTDSTPADICDDLYAEDFRAGRFDAIVFDYVAPTTDAFSMLAPFAKTFSGRGMDMSDTENYILTPHITGYDSYEYNVLVENIHAEKTISKRADMYREAEAMLMADMPIIPIVFNYHATVTSSNLKSVSSTYFLSANFQKVKVRNYDDYLADGKAFVTENFADLKFTEANDCAYKEFEAFKTANTVYSQFFLDEKEELQNAAAAK